MTDLSEPRKVLFLCTGNSCRSQIAEALVNHDLAGRWQAFSAGIMPAGYVHPLAVQVLAEVGIDHRGKSKWVDQFIGINFDQVITVCADADRNCPVWLGKGKKVHIGFADPALVQGTGETKLAVFRTLRDEMRQQLIEYLKKV